MSIYGFARHLVLCSEQLLEWLILDKKETSSASALVAEKRALSKAQLRPTEMSRCVGGQHQVLLLRTSPDWAQSRDGSQLLITPDVLATSCLLWTK
jgi:hypothetical protein